MSGGHGIGIPIPTVPNLPETPIFSVCELHMPENGQRDFVFKQTYSPGNNEILVYINGVLQFDTQYIEVSSTSIRTQNALTDSDVVLIIFNQAVSPQAPKQYSGSVRLMTNQIYTAQLAIGDTEHAISFTSRYDPLYSTAKIIRTDLGDWVKDVPDDVINYIIHENSILALELWANRPEDEITEIPYAVKQFVRYKTKISLVRSIYLGEIRSARLTKTLGNLTINRESRMPLLNDLLTGLEHELAKWESLLSGSADSLLRPTPRGATKARSQYDYPLGARRSF